MSASVAATSLEIRSSDFHYVDINCFRNDIVEVIKENFGRDVEGVWQYDILPASLVEKFQQEKLVRPEYFTSKTNPLTRFAFGSITANAAITVALTVVFYRATKEGCVIDKLNHHFILAKSAFDISL